jgi:hypothetical protein
MCEAFEAAKLQGGGGRQPIPPPAPRGDAAEARLTNRVEVQAEVATEVGLDLGRFLGALRDGTLGRPSKRASPRRLGTVSAASGASTTKSGPEFPGRSRSRRTSRRHATTGTSFTFVS